MPTFNEPDYYLKLIEDIIGEKIEDPNAINILQNHIKTHVSNKDVKIDDALKNSCRFLCDKLVINIDDMRVGSPPENDFGYVEPCPIQYTGDIKNGKRFHSVFLGLNPHLEPWRAFPTDTTFADLANFHHPHDIRHGCLAQRYSPEGEIKNNYWRVMGNMEPEYNRNDPWSGFYKEVIRIHLALLPNKNAEVYNNFERNVKNSPDLTTNKLLKKLEKFPIANVELIPFKSKDIDLERFENALKIDKYEKYFSDVIDFIASYSDENAYIIATNSIAGDNGSTPALDGLYKILKEKMASSYIDEENDFFVYIKDDKQFADKKSENWRKRKQPGKLAPMYLFRWGCRKVIVSPPISRMNTHYKWIYTDFENGWINAIRRHFGDGDD